MKTVFLKMQKLRLIQQTHFRDRTLDEIQEMADYVATHGKSYKTDTGTTVLVKNMKGSDYVVILKEDEHGKGDILRAKTFYRDTDGGIQRRIRIGQWW